MVSSTLSTTHTLGFVRSNWEKVMAGFAVPVTWVELILAVTSHLTGLASLDLTSSVLSRLILRRTQLKRRLIAPWIN